MANNVIESITSPLKAASDIASGLINLRDTIKFGEAVTNLLGQIVAAEQGALAAQQRETQMADEIRGLRESLDQLKRWEVVKAQYELECG